MKNLRNSFLFTHPVFGIFVLSAIIDTAAWIPIMVYTRPGVEEIFVMFFSGTAAYSILISPIIIIVTLYNIGYLAVPRQSEITKKRGRDVEYFTLLYGGTCTLFYIFVEGLYNGEIIWESHWSDQLYNDQLHSPVSWQYVPSIIVITLVAAVGYMLLRVAGDKELPPIPTALGIGGLYLGIILCSLWIIQLISEEILLCAYPANLILISIKLIRERAELWNESEIEIPEGKNPAITAVYTFMASSRSLPWLGFLFALPILGVCIAVLALFGQAPDSIIRAWTETADWTLSNHEGPQNIITDQHYLCTVAAGGHRKVVKPIRTGKRHGHTVIVNRQLCVANAFEGLLQERLPRFHKAVRRFYDKYGYPVAKHIRSPYAADAVWIMMKPLEWLFLLALYTFDTKPENRIAVQYPHTTPPKV